MDHPVPTPALPKPGRSAINDVAARDAMWRRLGGDDWAAFDALPAPARRRLHEHAYDAWAVNALALWQTFRRRHASTNRGLNTLLRYLDECEALERAAFAVPHLQSHGSPLPHVAAGASVLRCGAARSAG